jgi:two-component system, cell cycle response regulator DivK
MTSERIAKNALLDWDVLVVDDDAMSLQVANIILSYHGVKVHTAKDGQEGLEAVKSVRPKFIISDLSMPVLDGWGMIGQLKSDPSTAAIPIIALTAHAMTGDKERAIQAGCHNYLTKPLTPSTFMRELMRLLEDIPELSALLNNNTAEGKENV